ncbi:hypothetical protein [Fluviicoccus keumensis]|uniref:hypothetical protein n=1 Tax=Fluviicoccus keumensis TaxID=1435465 RepID=UPI00102CA3A7|nr:hypothetical protein [Fluviicoccus keumensis]
MGVVIAGVVLASGLSGKALAAKQTWVLPTDCQAEQAAIRANGDYEGGSTEELITQSIEFPWIYRFSFSRRGNGELMTPEDLKAFGDQLIQEGQANVDRYRNSYPAESLARIMRVARMKACPYYVAAERSAGPKPTPAPVKDCSQDASTLVNKSLQDIDTRVGAFMASNAGQAQGSPTPSLQVVMWATLQQARIIQRYCSGSAGYKERAESLESSFLAAQQACRQLQSRPEICEPVAPEQLMAGDDKARRDADAVKQQSKTGARAAVDNTPPGFNPAELPPADFMGYYTGQCLESGFSPVSSQGCVICGNPEGTLGAGFQWRKCQASSQGASAAR